MMRSSRRLNAGRLLAAAVMGLGWAGATPAEGALLVELRALEAPGGLISSDGKSVFLGFPSSSITFGIFARVSGANAVQQTGEFGGEPLDGLADTRNDDSVQIVTGNIKSSPGGLLGNFSVPTRLVPFNGPTSSDGALNDLDGDGDLDVGVNGVGPIGMFTARSGSPTHAVQTGNGTMLPTGSRILDATTSEMRLGLVTWTAIPGSFGFTSINFIPRPDPGPGAATWFEDGSVSPKNPDTGIYVAGAPVSVIPEPASALIISFASLALLRRRHRRADAAERATPSP